jgi:alanyl-tRNA synthetase
MPILKSYHPTPLLFIVSSQRNGRLEQRIAHTAEHAFIGSLQRVLGQTLQVRKVEHKPDGVTTAHIVIPSLELDKVVEAERITNSVILEGRAVTTRVYDSLEEARAANPGLRANEDRISGSVRVVRIEGHDVAACNMNHANNLTECDFFLVSRISKSGSEFEVDFVIGKEARDAAIEISAKFHWICRDLGASPNTIEPTTKKIKSELEACKSRLNSISTISLEEIPMKILGQGTGEKVEAYCTLVSHLSDDRIIEFAGEKISSKGSPTLVCIANESGDSARIVLAISERVSDKVNLNQLFRQHSAGSGKGGGRPHFVTGIIPSEGVQSFLDAILREFAAGLPVRVG